MKCILLSVSVKKKIILALLWFEFTDHNGCHRTGVLYSEVNADVFNSNSVNY